MMIMMMMMMMMITNVLLFNSEIRTRNISTEIAQRYIISQTLAY